MEEYYYRISESQLAELLEAALTLEMLERDGVDTWSWYGESRNEVIANYLECDIGKAEEYDFYDVADKLIHTEYERIE